MEYTIVEGDHNKDNLRWIVVSNNSGTVWGMFATKTDATLFVLAMLYPGKLIDHTFIW